MGGRIKLFAIFMMLTVAVFLLGFTPLIAKADAAETYEFEVSKEVATPDSKKFDVSTIKKAAADKKKPSAVIREIGPVWRPPEKSNLIVKTGSGALSMQGKDLNRIYDFGSMKIYDVNPSTKTYLVHSLYADLALREGELKNRLTLHDVVGKTFKGQRAKTFFEDFFNEEKYSLTLPDRNSAYVLDKTHDGDTDLYKFKSTTVTSFAPSSTGLTGDKMRQFSLFLIYGTHLHPLVREDIEKSGKVPQKLMVYVDNHPVLQERTTYVLKKVSSSEYVAEIPAGYSRTYAARDPLLPVYLRIQELGGGPPADLKQQTLEYFKKAVEKKNYLDALLAISEYGIQTGENLKNEMASISEQIKIDPDCQRLMIGLPKEKQVLDEKRAMLELGALDAIDRRKTSKGYLIDVFRANLIVDMNEHGINNLAPKEDDDPGSTFIRVLKQNPFLTGVYRDLGDYYESTNMQPYAWECYDLALKFYPKYPYLRDVAEREHELRSNFPQFFSGDQL